ncbi:aspartyl protease [Dendronalium sp. ChiSLP03b]|uniref:aspartyl protease n=1 Tax=Dendronalium sp. ChiSLP03b TaxID=3075381 RepID=UPI00391AE82B
MTISGFFGDEDALLFEINLITSDGLELPVEAMFDTGFSYWLAINKQDIDALGWERLQEQTMRTARGDVKFEIYVGQVLFKVIPINKFRGLSKDVVLRDA